MRFLCILATTGCLALVSTQSSGAEPAPTGAVVQPVAKDYITIYGEVARQGRYQLDPKVQMNVGQAVRLMAGGAKAGANLKKVKLIRVLGNGPMKSTTIINLEDGANIPFVRPRDIIIVSEPVKLD